MDDVFVDGREAERLLNDPTLKKAFDRIEGDYIARWKVAGDREKREHLHACVTAIADIRAQLNTMKQTKANAEAENKRFGRPTR